MISMASLGHVSWVSFTVVRTWVGDHSYCHSMVWVASLGYVSQAPLTVVSTWEMGDLRLFLVSTRFKLVQSKLRSSKIIFARIPKIGCQTLAFGLFLGQIITYIDPSKSCLHNRWLGMKEHGTTILTELPDALIKSKHKNKLTDTMQMCIHWNWINLKVHFQRNL